MKTKTLIYLKGQLMSLIFNKNRVIFCDYDTAYVGCLVGESPLGDYMDWIVYLRNGSILQLTD